jgi:phenolphthiocerol/phthiocerol/phthiodiolone dimycocerosyl transferase
MRRKLAPSELVYAGEIRTRAMTVCVVRGGVDEDLLDTALTTVLAEHRSLRSRLEHDGDQYFLTSLDGDEELHLTVRPAGALVEEYNTPLRFGGPMVRTVLLRGTDEDTLVLSVDHAVCDGRSATALCDALWRRYSEIQGGAYTARQGPAHGWPPPIDDLLPACAQAERDDYLRRRIEGAAGAPIAMLPFLATRSGDAPAQERAMGSRRLRLTREQTAGLVAFARSVDVSVHGIVGAALLAAVREGLPLEQADHRLACVSTVDLRERVRPPISRDVLMAAASWYQDLLDVPAGADVVALGRRLTTKLRAAVGRGDPALELRVRDRLMEHPQLLTASLLLMNVGSVPGPPAPPGLEIVDMSKFPISSRWVPQMGQGALIASPMTVYGRLSIEMPFSAQCFTPGQLDAIHDLVLATLLDLADRAPSGATSARAARAR